MAEVDPLEEARARLGFHLEVQEGFWFALAVSNDARSREALRDWVRGEREIRVLHVLDDGPAALLEVILDDEGHLTWVVADGDPDRWEAATAELLLALNERRERLRQNPGPLLIEGRERLKAVLRNLAPDLFSIRACVVETGASAVTQGGPEEAPISELDRFNHEVVAGALRQARDLDGRETPGARRSRVGALTRAAEALIAHGWFGEAAPVVAELRVEAYRLASEQFAEPWALGATALAESLTGAIARAAGDLDGATAAFGTATWLRSLLHQKGDSWTARDLARARSELGQVLLARGDLEGAEVQLTQSIELVEAGLRSGRDDPELATQGAMTLSVLGDVYLAGSGEDAPSTVLVAAREALERALAIRQDLASIGAVRYRRYLGIAWGQMGKLAEAEGDLDEALRARERAAGIAKELAASHPDNAAWDVEYATTATKVGDVRLARGEPELAEAVLQDAHARIERNLEEDPANARWQGSLARTGLRLAVATEAAGDPDGAHELVEEAVELLESLVARDPTNQTWARDLELAVRHAQEIG